MRIVQLDQQARTVTHLVLALTQLIGGLLILGYRVWEPTQLLLFHTLSYALLISSAAIGATLLSYDLYTKRWWQPILSRVFAGIALIAAICGYLGCNANDVDSQIHPMLYVAMGGISIWLLLRIRSATFLTIQRALAAPLSLVMLAIFVLHFIYEQPLVARHPIGSLVGSSLILFAALSLWNLSRTSHAEMPAVSRFTTGFVIVGLLAATALGLSMFHSEMSEVRKDGQLVAENLNQSRRTMGDQHLSTINRLAQRWSVYPEEVQRELMLVDINSYLSDIDFIESIMVMSDRSVIWERNKYKDVEYSEIWEADPRLKAAAAEELTGIELLVASKESSDDGARMFVRISLALNDKDAKDQSFSVVAVFNVPVMLGLQAQTLASPIRAYTEMTNGWLLDDKGHWVTDKELDYLNNNALFLHKGVLTTKQNREGVPVHVYMVDLSQMQGRANLEIMLSLIGIVLVLLMALTIERNSELIKQGRLLKFQAEHDELTGLLNRDTVEKHLGVRFFEQENLTALFVDLDGFTLINDSLGLQVGDRLLQMLANRLREVTPEAILLGRFSGDEFLIVFEHLHENDAAVKELTDKVLAVVAKPYHIMHHKIYITASIGVAHQSDDQFAPLELVQRADMAMHKAKSLGHNHVQVYQDRMSLHFKASAAMRSSLQEAIEKNQLDLHFQPIVRCHDTATVGYEALLRWEREPGRFVPPSEFIPLAEMTGQIIPLSEWVFRRACEAAVRLQSQGDFKVAVNLSTLHFNRIEFKPFLEQTLRETGCKPEWLELELTESILMDNMEFAVSVLEELRANNISISLDDFGTGFSSLSYLKTLPVDKVKIDRSFVAGIRSHRSDRVLIQSVIKIAQSLHFEVVAEGVETPQQAEFLTELGCDYMQGYYFARPQPLKDC